MRKKSLCLGCAWMAAAIASAGVAWANSAPVVTNVVASQRQDASKLIDIRYDLSDEDGDACTIWVSISDDGGASWQVPARTFSGDIGPSIALGTGKRIIWDAGADIPWTVGPLKVRVWADDGKGWTANVLVPGGSFPYQNTTPMIHIDTFFIDKYEVTNEFYCQFLNNADPNATHWKSYMEINRTGDAGRYAYAVAPGKGDYPVRWVTWDDATAFAAWRSKLEGVNWRLPTEQEWEKAAAWDPVEQKYYTYGYHSDGIDCSWSNYRSCVGTPTPVGYYDGTDGRQNAQSYYGCYDMSGNLMEWTNGWELGLPLPVLRGGSWNNLTVNCTCTWRGIDADTIDKYGIKGFRLVLDPD